MSLNTVENIDAADGDWIKRGDWDLWRGDQLVASVPDLLEWLWNARMTVDDFKQTTVYLSHVEDMPWLRNL